MVRPSACASDAVSLPPQPEVDADGTDGFRPMQPMVPPPEHLRRWDLTPKMGSGLAKQMSSPPAKRGRYE